MFKTTKRALAVLLAVLMLVCYVPFASFAEGETEPATSGFCGTNATWAYDAETKTLTISGTGATASYGQGSNLSPWSDLLASIQKVVVGEGITALSQNFMFCGSGKVNNVKEIVLPEGLELIGTYAFNATKALEKINFPKSLKKIDSSAFTSVDALTEATYAGTAKDWAAIENNCAALFDKKVTFHPHTYANPVFDWSSTGEGEAMVWTATKAIFTCECGATIDVTAKVESTKTEPECVTAGSMVYTATATPAPETYGEVTIGTFANELYTDTKTVELGATGHTFPLTPHAKADATCTAAGTEAYWECSACHLLFSDAEGKNKIDNPIEIPQKPHNFVKGEGADMQHNEDNTHSYKCKDCNTFGDPEECTIGDWEDGTVTCTASGAEVKKCSVCGGVCETREATAKGHIYTGNAINNNDATDESEGTHTMTCKYCGKHSVEKNPHQWNNGTVELAPTCMSDGTIVFTCTVPGCDATKEQAITKSGHDFYDLKIEKAKNEDGSYTVTASAYCKTEKKYIEEKETATLQVDESATCKKTGKGHYEATFTKGFFAETNGLYTFEINNGVLPVDPAAHDLVKVPAVAPTCKNGGNGGNKAYWRCKICGDLFADVAGAEGEESTPGDKINEAPLLSALTHTPVTTIENVVTATCTVAGSYDEVVTCSRCGDLISRTHHDGEMLKHQLTKKGTPATCTEDGIDAYWECSECKKMFSDENATTKIDMPVTIPKLGHNFTPAEDENGKISNIVPNSDKTHSFTCKNEGCNAVGAVINGQQTEGGKIACSFSGEWEDDPNHRATCQESGIQYKACDSQCGNKQEQTIDTRLHDYSVPKALGDHTQEAEGAGFHAYYCSYDCGQYDVQRKEAHKWTAWQDLETDPTTCSHLGKITRKCSVCGLKEEKDAPEKLTHTFPEEKSYDVVAKTTDAGTTYTVNAFTACSNCHEIFTEEVVAAVVVTEGKEPTCSATGEGTYVAKFKAPFEDYTILDEDGQPVKAVIAKDPNAHKLSPVEKKDATCEEDGYEAYWKCELCTKLFLDDKGTNPTTLEAVSKSLLGHEFKVENGVQYVTDHKHNFKCTRCEAYGIVVDGQQVKNGTVACDYSDWTADNATCEQSGKQTRTCSVCSHVDEKTTAALGHDFKEENGVQYVADHKHNFKCTRCDAYGVVADGQQVKDGTVDCNYSDWTADTATCEQPGKQTRTCSVCGHVDEKTTDPRGHEWGDWTKLDDDQHQRVCKTDSTHVESADHTTSVKTEKVQDTQYKKLWHCVDVTYCTVCNAELGRRTYDKTEDCNHIYTTKDIDPTCEKEGTRIYTCRICGHVETETLAKLDHNDKDNDGYCDNGCGQMMTGGNHCKYCGKIHDGLFGWLVGFFHSILAIFKR